MKLSTKGRYAMIALTDLALQRQDSLTSLSDISKRQGISLAYLEQLFVNCGEMIWLTWYVVRMGV